MCETPNTAKRVGPLFRPIVGAAVRAETQRSLFVPTDGIKDRNAMFAFRGGGRDRPVKFNTIIVIVIGLLLAVWIAAVARRALPVGRARIASRRAQPTLDNEAALLWTGDDDIRCLA